MAYDDYRDILYAPRPALNRKAMDIRHRAKQFAPFAALKGFEEGIQAKELVYEPKRELSEDQTAELNFRLRMLQYGMRITVTYFTPGPAGSGKGQYHDYTGKVQGFKPDRGLFMDTMQIREEDLYDLKGDGLDDPANLVL